MSVFGCRVRCVIPLALAVGLCLHCGKGMSQQSPSVDVPDGDDVTDRVDEPPTRLDPSQRFQQLITRIALENIPHEYVDNKDWGKTTEIWAGIRIRREGLRITTKRRKKQVNHGTWKRYRISLVDPEQRFHVRVENVHETAEGRVEFDAWVDASLSVFGRLSQWERSVQLLSIGVDADARVRLRVHCSLGVELDPMNLPPDVVLDPVITDADLQIVDFRIRRVSDLSGPIVRPLSHQVREVLEDRIAKRRGRLIHKINRQIDKNRDDLRLSLHDVLESKWGEAAAEHLQVEGEPSDATETVE